MSIWTKIQTATRPVAIIGGGVLGRRLAMMWCSTGKSVVLCDKDPKQVEAAIAYVDENVGAQSALMKAERGAMTAVTNMQEAVKDAWMVIEAIPEILDLKVNMMGQLDRLVKDDCILATNSSSYRSSQMLNEVHNRHRVLNTHYYSPPKHKCVELMSSGYTDSAIIDLLLRECASVGFVPIHVKKESTGFIFNRIWAAIKRESLDVMAEGVAEPKDIDILFKDWFAAERGPSEMMDQVGLDTVWNIEKNYVEQRGLKHDALDWLKREYVDKGKLGQKSGNNGLLGS